MSQSKPLPKKKVILASILGAHIILLLGIFVYPKIFEEEVEVIEEVKNAKVIMTLDIEGIDSEEPDETPKPPDETPKPLDETPKPPDEAPKTPDEAPKPPDETPKTPEEIRDKENRDKENRDKEKRDKEKRDKEKRDKEKRDKEKRDKEKRDKEKRDKEKRDKEKRDKEKRDKEKRDKEKRERLDAAQRQTDLTDDYFKIFKKDLAVIWDIYTLSDFEVADPKSEFTINITVSKSGLISNIKFSKNATDRTLQSAAVRFIRKVKQHKFRKFPPGLKRNNLILKQEFGVKH